MQREVDGRGCRQAAKLHKRPAMTPAVSASQLAADKPDLAWVIICRTFLAFGAIMAAGVTGAIFYT